MELPTPCAGTRPGGTRQRACCYSLNDVEERTYTYGMLRALGMKRVTLIQIMLLKAITFSIPATFVALILVQLMNIPVIKLIEDFAYLNLSFKLPSICFINGIKILLSIIFVNFAGFILITREEDILIK